MTDALTSLLFGRRKPKGPAPSPPQKLNEDTTNNGSEDFVVVGNSEFMQYPQLVNTNRAKREECQPVPQSAEYESLYSFLNCESSSNPTRNGHYRPGRQAPPVPAPRTHAPQGSMCQHSIEVQTSAYYLSGVPFEIPASLGGSVKNHLYELSQALSCIKAPNLDEYEYPFQLEEEVLRETDAVRNA